MGNWSINSQNLPEAEVIKYNLEISARRGNLTQHYDIQIKINNRSGEKYGKIQIPYSKIMKASKINAQIEDSYGNVVRKLKKEEIVDKSAISDFSFYEDDFVKEFTLKHNSYPYYIDYSFELHMNEFLSIAHWDPVIDNDIPTHNASLKLTVPINYPIRYKDRFIDDFKTDTTDQDCYYEWRTSYNEKLEHELLSPPLDQFLPTVVIVPEMFEFETNGSFKSWNDFGNWQHELIKDLGSLPDSEKEKIKSLISGIKDTVEQIKILYHYLQDETRYINISIETGGLKPYPASYVADKKYGDCKALTNYFKSVLDFIGIKSYYTKVLSGYPIDKIDQSFPSQQFDHIILYVPLIKDTLWLDCTSDGPFNYLGTFTQNRFAFIIKDDSSMFIKTPSLSIKDVLIDRNVTFHNDTDNELYVKFRYRYRGYLFEQLANISNNMSQNRKDRIVRNDFVQNGFEITNYQISIPHRDSTYIDLTYTAKPNNHYKKYGNDLIIKVLPTDFPKLNVPGERQLPVQIDFPIAYNDTINYIVPDKYKIVNYPQNNNINNEVGNYSLQVKSEGQIITLIRNFVLNTGYYDQNEYEKFYLFVKEVQDTDDKSIIVSELKQH